MSTFLSAFQHNYIQNFPTQVPIKAAQSFVATALINVMTGSASTIALAGGCLAATATIIEAVIRPIIKNIFSEHPSIATMTQIIIPTTIALSLAPALVPCFGVVYKTTSVLLPLLAWMTLNQNFYKNNVGMAVVF